MTIMMGAGGTTTPHLGLAAPEVSAVAASDTNSRGIGGDCSVGLIWNIDGQEYDITNPGSQGTDLGTWLDVGNSDQVWVEFLYSSGSASQWIGKANSTRFNINVTQTFRIEDTSTGPTTETITGQFRFWDAASGGNILQTTTASQQWIADYEEICPMCCFTPWTKITMADGSKIPIENIKVGDLIAVKGGIEPVSEIIIRENRPMHLIKFKNGRVLEASEDHPLYVEGKGYAAVNPDPRIEYKDLGIAEVLVVGDKVIDEAGRTNEITVIEDMHYPMPVYTFENSKFYANGMLVY